MCLKRSLTHINGNFREKIFDISLFTYWSIAMILNCIVLITGHFNIQFIYQELNSEGSSIQVDTILLPCVICGVALTYCVFGMIKLYANTGLYIRVTVMVLSGFSFIIVSFDFYITVLGLVSSIFSFHSIPEIREYS